MAGDQETGTGEDHQAESQEAQGVSFSPLRSFPIDLAAVLVFVGLAAVAVFHPQISETPLRLALGLPFLLFLPGYALVSALFPRKAPVKEEQEFGERAVEGMVTKFRARGVDGTVRLALAFGASVAVVPLVGLLLDLTWGIRLVPAMVAIGGFTVACTVVAALRRWALSPEERFAVPAGAWYASIRDGLLEPETTLDAALNLLVVLSLLFAAAGVVYAVSPPVDDGGTTGFSLLAEDDEGDLIAHDHPTEFVVGEGAVDGEPVVLEVVNNRGESVEYTLVVELQDVAVEEADEGAGVSVTDREELDRVEIELSDGERWQETYEPAPNTTGEDLRLAFMLYEGEPPEEPTLTDADAGLHLWVDVFEDGGDGEEGADGEDG